MQHQNKESVLRGEDPEHRPGWGWTWWRWGSPSSSTVSRITRTGAQWATRAPSPEVPTGRDIHTLGFGNWLKLGTTKQHKRPPSLLEPESPCYMPKMTREITRAEGSWDSEVTVTRSLAWHPAKFNKCYHYYWCSAKYPMWLGGERKSKKRVRKTVSMNKCGSEFWVLSARKDRICRAVTS